MMTKHEPAKGKTFVGTFLPWLVAISGLVLYLATLDRWASLNNFLQAARISGDLPGMDLNSPVYYLVTYPLHWIPGRSVPLGLNILSAVWGALILALLARSVALLPHDRTHDQRQREDGAFLLLSIRDAWLPPVLGAFG